MRKFFGHIFVGIVMISLLSSCAREASTEAGSSKAAQTEEPVKVETIKAAEKESVKEEPAPEQKEKTEISPLPMMPGAVGEVFHRPVTSQEYLYQYKTASMFTRMAKEMEGLNETLREDARRIEAWQNLIYGIEAKAIGIDIPAEELNGELKRLVEEQGIVYGSSEYKEWVPKVFNESVETFEGRIKDLLVVNKFLSIKANPEVEVTEEEMLQKFLNQYNSFESEYILFDTEEAAAEFESRVKADPKVWWDTYEEKKELGQKGASWINSMTLEALIDLWKIPKDEAYKIVESKPGDFMAAHNYYGPVVVRLLNNKRADMEQYDEKKKEYYREMLTRGKKQRIVKEYFDDLLERASFRDYVEEKRQKEKIELMKKKSLVMMKTSKGEIALRLFPESAPLAVENFIGLVEKGYYNGIAFHRVIKDFMIQGGDPTGTGAGGESFWGESPFVDEIKEDMNFDEPGVLAMANSGPDTNKSQFFITVAPAKHLNGRHTIFGKVILGMDVVNAISLVETATGDKPVEDVVIVEAAIVKE